MNFLEALIALNEIAKLRDSVYLQRVAIEMYEQSWVRQWHQLVYAVFSAISNSEDPTPLLLKNRSECGAVEFFYAQFEKAYRQVLRVDPPLLAPSYADASRDLCSTAELLDLFRGMDSP